jgi:phospholipid transport system substrate-binding protein
MIRITLAIFFLATLAGAAPGPPPQGEAAVAIRTGNERFRGLLSKKVPKGSDEERKLARQLTSDMRSLFDIKDLTRRSLIDHWEKLTPTQRDELVGTMQGLIERSYLKQLRSNLQYQVDYIGEETKQDDVIVHTAIHAESNGRPTTVKVDYLMHRENGGWRVFDVVTDDVGMIRNYRSQFNRIVAKEGVKGLMAKLTKKLSEESD